MVLEIYMEDSSEHGDPLHGYTVRCVRPGLQPSTKHASTTLKKDITERAC
jgi:hypothetical protein